MTTTSLSPMNNQLTESDLMLLARVTTEETADAEVYELDAVITAVACKCSLSSKFRILQRMSIELEYYPLIIPYQRNEYIC